MTSAGYFAIEIAKPIKIIAILKQDLTPFISKFFIGSIYYLLPFRFRSQSLMTTKQMITKASNSTYDKLNKVSVCDGRPSWT